MSRCLSFVIILLIVAVACGMEVAAQSGGFRMSLKPVLLSAQDSGAAQLGLQYSCQYTHTAITFDDDALWIAELGVLGEGTLVTEQGRNPLDLVDTRAEALLLYSPSDAVVLRGGAQASLEGTQEFTSKQWVYAAKLGVYYSMDNRGSAAALHARIGRMHPSADPDRQQVLPDGGLDPYTRVDVELWVQWIIGNDVVQKAEFLGRYFRELSPSAAIASAQLHRYAMHTIRLLLPGGVFLAYSQGRLPFDARSDRIYQLGLKVTVR